jgi:hypothetical protein
MTNIQELIDRCEAVVRDWKERQCTIETVNDFAAVFGMELNYQLVPKDVVADVKKVEKVQEQTDLFPELSRDDRSMLSNWRTNNGLY